MNRIQSSITSFSLLATVAVAQDPRESLEPAIVQTDAYETFADIQTKVLQGYRPIDLEVRTTNPMTYTMVYLKNAGSYQNSW